MGGQIGFTLRLSMTEEYRMSWWTNELSYKIKNAKFILNNPIYINNEIISDYKSRNKKKYNDNQLVPLEYGIIVVDFVTNNFIVNSNYSNFCSILFSTIKDEVINHIDFELIKSQANGTTKEFVEKTNWEEYALTCPEGDIFDLYEFYKTNRIKECVSFHKNDTDVTFENFNDLITNIFNSKFLGGGVYFDTSPLKYQRFKCFETTKKEILKLGFKLTDREEKMWERRRIIEC